MSSTSSEVTYTSVYTDSEPGRLVAPPSSDYIPDPEEPQTLPVPQDEDERDEHVFPVEEQPLHPVDSATAKSLGYVAESDPEEDPEEYEDNKSDLEDGLVDYPMDGGEDRDDDGSDSSEDDADNEDEDEEEEEHLAPADSAVVVPTVEPVSPPEGTEPVIPPPSTDISTTGARIIVRLQASISLPPKAEVKRLPAMPTPPPSLLISLLPPSAGEHLARCTTPSAHSSPPPVTSPLLPSFGCPSRGGLCFLRGLGLCDRIGSGVHETRSQMQQAEMAELRETGRRCQAQMVETLRVMRDTKREMGDMQAELLALREQQMRARQPGPDSSKSPGCF
ncbi:hypothetical protein Tco_0769332 [Tanacetum coccineum]|uniref:Uncharacterized protein n=1 Tax=Tanacetum coccineum TaxID=301880 RepID=A0ABQ4ZAV7_9ASTR